MIQFDWYFFAGLWIYIWECIDAKNIRRLFVSWWNWIQWYWVLQSPYALMTKDPRHRDEEVLPTCDAEMTSCHGVTSWCQASSPDWLQIAVFLGPPKNKSLIPPTKKSMALQSSRNSHLRWRSKTSLSHRGGLGTAAHTPDVRPTEQSGHVNGHHVARDLIPTVLEGRFPQKNGALCDDMQGAGCYG